MPVTAMIGMGRVLGFSRSNLTTAYPSITGMFISKIRREGTA
jgi:hypothetical protein